MNWFRCACVSGMVLLGACQTAAPPDADLADADSPPELVSMLQELLPRIERLSGLERIEPLRMRRQDRAGFMRYIETRMDSELPPERLDGVLRAYAALGLVPDTLNLRALLMDLYTEQVLGYYDARTTTLYVLDGEDTESLRPVLAHELVHALQDQHTNLDSLVAFERGADRQAAAHAALEGHAMIVMFAALAEEAGGDEVDPASLPNPADELGPALAMQNEAFPVFQRAPQIIRETLLFPYIGGSNFVYHVWQVERGAERYPAPIDSLLPQSTAQVMRPVDRFVRQRTAPVEVRFEPPAGVAPVYENTLGQLETSIFLAAHLGERSRAVASGWAGDRYALMATAGADVLHWVSVWESDAEADRFAAAVRRTAGLRPGRSVQVSREEVGGHAGVRVTDVPAGAAVEVVPLPVRILPAAP